MISSQNTLANRLTLFSLNRKITVLVLFFSIIIVGVIAMLGIPLELFPRGYESPFLGIFIPWRNAPSQEVLEKITLPLEEELSTIKGIDALNSWTATGRAHLWLRFKHQVDMGIAYREVRDRVERAKLRFPEDVEQTFIHKDDPSGIPVCVIGMVIDPDLTDFYHLIDKEIVLPMSRIDGVVKVTTDGLEEKEIIIEVDKQRADSYGVNIYQLGQTLGTDNFTLTSGHVQSGGHKYLLRSVATYRSLAELENRLVGPSVRVKDIATLRYEEAEKRYCVRVNGRPAVALVIFKAGDANTIEVSGRVETALKKMQGNPRLSGIYLESIFDQGTVIQDSVGSLLAGGRIGGLLAALVLFFFLQRVRLTAIITLAIPLSLLIALIVMFFMGETLNILSILGLMICVGLLVDNSVVVAENIHRYHQDGLPPRTACLQGASEIALAITLATLTTVIVFLPAALVEGEGQFFLIRLATPVSVSLIASLLVALVFIPLSVLLTVPRAAPGRFVKPHPLAHRLHHFLGWLYAMSFQRLHRYYHGVLDFFLQRRIDLVLGVAVIFAFTYFITYKHIETVPVQEEDRTSFYIDVDFESYYSYEDIGAYFGAAEKVLAEKKDAYGLRGYLVLYRPGGGRFEGWLDKDRPQPWTAKQVAEKLLKELPAKPGVQLNFGRESQVEENKEKEVYEFRLEGQDPVLLDRLIREFEPRILNLPGVLGVRQGNEESPSELAMLIQRERATASQVNPEFVAGVIAYALRGRTLPRYNDQGKEIPVRVRFQLADRSSIENLNNFQVPTATGELLPVSALTEVKVLDTPKGIHRRNKKTSRGITVELKSGQANETRPLLEALKKSIDLPEGVAFAAHEDWRRHHDENIANLRFAAMLSIVFIYLLMGFLFESFILPLSIILTIPLAGIGVAWIHYLTGRDLDFLGLIGGILLIGVVVNNGIVLIDYVHRLCQEGLDRHAALIRAADRRFRPIIMTALTTIIGMIPLTLSRTGELGLSYKSFGLTLIGGMSTATLLTLVVVPVFYSLFDDARIATSQAARRAVVKRQSPAPEWAPPNT